MSRDVKNLNSTRCENPTREKNGRMEELWNPDARENGRIEKLEEFVYI